MPQKIEFSTPASRAQFAVQPPAEGRTLPTLAGYAVVWGATSADDRSARIALGAVTFPADASPVHALYNHDYRDLIGSTANGTLRLSSDNVGLRVEIDPPDTQAGRDVVTLVRDGYVAGMSFGMYGLKYTDTQEAGRKVRTYTKVLVYEVTITAIPAFTVTSIAVIPTPTPLLASAKLQAAELTLKELSLTP